VEHPPLVGSNFNPPPNSGGRNPRNTKCIPVVNPSEADRFPPQLKVRGLRLELEPRLNTKLI